MQRKPIDLAIREANDRDTVAVAEVLDAAFLPLRTIYQPTRQVIERQAAHDQRGVRLVGTVDGNPVATVQFDIHPRHLHVIGLAVHPDFQRMGLARCLLDSIAERARSLQRPLIVLDTIQETGNVAVFEKLGFQLVNSIVATWCVSRRHGTVHEVRLQRHLS